MFSIKFVLVFLYIQICSENITSRKMSMIKKSNCKQTLKRLCCCCCKKKKTRTELETPLLTMSTVTNNNGTNTNKDDNDTTIDAESPANGGTNDPVQTGEDTPNTDFSPPLIKDYFHDSEIDITEDDTPNNIHDIFSKITAKLQREKNHLSKEKFKLIIVGAERSGKTALLLKLLTGKNMHELFTEKYANWVYPWGGEKEKGRVYNYSDMMDSENGHRFPKYKFSHWIHGQTFEPDFIEYNEAVEHNNLPNKPVPGISSF